MSGRGNEDSVARDCYPEEYRRSEFDEYAASLPYGAARPRGFSVAGGALLLFFGAFLVFVVLLVVSPTGGYFPIAATVLLLGLFIALSLYMWSGLRRYMGTPRAPDEAPGRRGRG